MVYGAQQHCLRTCTADFGACQKRGDVAMVGMCATDLEAMVDGLEANGIAAQTLLYTLLQFLAHRACMCHGILLVKMSPTGHAKRALVLGSFKDNALKVAQGLVPGRFWLS